MIDAGEIKTRLAQDAESVCSYLLPGGKRVGNEWRCASISGGAGKSLGVRLEGTKAGVWCDFDGGVDSGDLLDLWKDARCGGNIVEAMEEARVWLGVRPAVPAFARPKPKDKPKPVSTEGVGKVAGSKVHKWLNSRGITDEAIRAYRIGKDASGNAVFPCIHGDAAMMLKYRTPDTKKIWASKDSTPALFGWQVVPAGARAVVITEGELDAMSYFVQGIPAMSVPFGAGGGQKQAWIETEFDRLDRFDRIYVSMDMDAEGQATVPELVDRLGRHRVFVVELPEKDGNACHEKGVELAPLVAAAQTRDPDELRSSRVYHAAVMERFNPPDGKLPGMPVPWTTNAINDNFRFREGELTVWSGYNGQGKSMVLSHVAVFGATLNHKFCIASMEMMPATTLMRMYQQCGAVEHPSDEYAERIRDALDGYIWLFDARGSTKAKRILEIFEYARRRYGIGQFIVDSLAKCGIGEDDYSAQKIFVEQLADFAREHSCHVHLVAHARKREDEKGEPGKMDVKGSGGVTDMADNVVSVWRNKRKEEAVQKCERDHVVVPPDLLDDVDAMLRVLKQRNHDWERGIGLWFDTASHQYLQEQDSKPVDYVQEGEL